MDILTYAALSAVIILIWHMAMNTRPSNFDLALMIGIFVFGGFIGWYMHSMELALIFSILLGLIFI